MDEIYDRSGPEQLREIAELQQQSGQLATEVRICCKHEQMIRRIEQAEQEQQERQTEIQQLQADVRTVKSLLP